MSSLPSVILSLQSNFCPFFVMSSSLSSSLCDIILLQDFPACTRLLSCTHSLASLHHVVGSPKFHRYCQERTTEWLKKKVKRTVKALGKTNISVGEGVKSMTYVRVKKESETQEGESHSGPGLIPSNSIHPILIRQMRKLSDKPVEAGEDYTKFNSSNFACKPPKKMSAAQKTLAKVDKTGMKSMSAAFSPKGKAEKN
uniref:Uncharacterized protein n=1 Tax=Hucho hucho TaxID=62062 RepID=A0A4W5MLV1_9TELE